MCWSEGGEILWTADCRKHRFKNTPSVARNRLLDNLISSRKLLRALFFWGGLCASWPSRGLLGITFCDRAKTTALKGELRRTERRHFPTKKGGTETPRSGLFDPVCWILTLLSIRRRRSWGRKKKTLTLNAQLLSERLRCGDGVRLCCDHRSSDEARLQARTPQKSDVFLVLPDPRSYLLLEANNRQLSDR